MYAGDVCHGSPAGDGVHRAQLSLVEGAGSSLHSQRDLQPKLAISAA